MDLKRAGVHVYAEDPTTDIWCAAYAFGDEDVQLWVPGEPCPPRIIAHILAGGIIVAHNAQFERLLLQHVAAPRYGWPVPKLEQWRCTAAMAAAMALPRHLDALAKALGVSELKDDEGHRLMLRMARPRKVNPDGTLVWWNVPEKLERLYAYCKQDVRTERAIEKALQPLTPRELTIYQLDQRINDRGVGVDLELVMRAQGVVNEGVRRANAELAELTNGEVTAITNHKRLLAWLNEADVETASVSKAAIAALREQPNLPDDVQQVLQLRSEAGRSSVAKLKATVQATCKDGRARGLLLYNAASTGRWAGRLIQPQNFPRGEVNNVESFIPAVLAGEYDEIAAQEPPILVVLSMLRSMLTAAPGKQLIAGDFASIEARVLNWLAGQDDVVGYFRDFDAGDKSKNPYKIMAVRMGRGASPADIAKPSEDYQAGKAAELGCGYGMGWSKFVSAAWSVYQVRVTDAQAKQAVTAYRDSHPKVRQLWYDVENACIAAVRKPGELQVFGGRKNLKAIVRGSYLYIILPSGRPLYYAAPSVENVMTPWGEQKPALHFYGVNAFSKQWGKMSAYGGLLVENIVQAVSRDLLASAMLRCEERGYLPVLSVHDEIVSEVPTTYGTWNEDDFRRLMELTPKWAEGLPIAVETWAGQRYRK